MRGLRGKRVLVSGGSSGIGAAAARRFLEEGCRVFVGGLDPDEVERRCTTCRTLGEVHGVAADVSDEDGAASLVEAASRALGGLDVLANNAGTAWREPFLQITAAALGPHARGQPARHVPRRPGRRRASWSSRAPAARSSTCRRPTAWRQSRTTPTTTPPRPGCSC